MFHFILENGAIESERKAHKTNMKIVCVVAAHSLSLSHSYVWRKWTQIYLFPRHDMDGKKRQKEKQRARERNGWMQLKKIKKFSRLFLTVEIWNYYICNGRFVLKFSNFKKPLK